MTLKSAVCAVMTATKTVKIVAAKYLIISSNGGGKYTQPETSMESGGIL